MRQNRHGLFDMNPSENFGVSSRIGVHVFKCFGVAAVVLKKNMNPLISDVHQKK